MKAQTQKTSVKLKNDVGLRSWFMVFLTNTLNHLKGYFIRSIVIMDKDLESDIPE